MSTVASANETPVEVQSDQRKRGCLFYVKRTLKWFGIALAALVLLGVGYQTIATELDKRSYAPRGELHTVNGHQMHIVCMGEGNQTVVLQAGFSAESLWWYRVQNQLAEHTRVCAYDRPGMGWSEPVEGLRDALTIADELHALLGEADIPAPYIMVGHSFGSPLMRIYAAQYPEEVVGLVLVDSHPVYPKHFASQSEFEQWQSGWNAFTTPLWVMTRTGIIRLTSTAPFQNAGYPADIVPELAALQARNQSFDTYRAEYIPARLALTEASSAAEDLGNLPMAVLWASQTHGMNQSSPNLTGLTEELSTYSSNTVTRIVEGADHGSILGNEQYAQQVTDAILDVIEAAQSGEPFAQ
jgi:pimeloyl-ACP methyl ester carboxylesterase